ncbi:MAG: Spy/CpxP family protein refolding chaperone [Psychromonas sp.]
MKSLFNKKLLTIAILVMAFSSSYAIQSGEVKKDSPPLPKILEQVNLTIEQQNKIQMILQNYRDDIDRLTNESDFSNNIVAIIKAKQFQTKDAESLIDAMNEVRKKREMKKMHMMHKVFHSLTAEQQDQLQKLFSQQ